MHGEREAGGGRATVRQTRSRRWGLRGPIPNAEIARLCQRIVGPAEAASRVVEHQHLNANVGQAQAVTPSSPHDVPKVVSFAFLRSKRDVEPLRRVRGDAGSVHDVLPAPTVGLAADAALLLRLDDQPALAVAPPLISPGQGEEDGVARRLARDRKPEAVVQLVVGVFPGEMPQDPSGTAGGEGEVRVHRLGGVAPPESIPRRKKSRDRGHDLIW